MAVFNSVYSGTKL